MRDAIVLLPEPECPTMATDWLGSIVKLKLRRIAFLREGYLNHKFLNSTLPWVMLSDPPCFGSILEGSSMMPNIFLAESLALEIDGSWDRETPDPMEPTKTT